MPAPATAETGSDRDGHPPGWWRRRSWSSDLAVLRKLRDGLLSMPMPDATAARGAARSDSAGPSGGPAVLISEPDGAPSTVPGGSEAGQTEPAHSTIRDTFAAVAKAGDEAAGYFYAWLFLRRPELRELFPPAMDEQRDRLFRALTKIVDSLGTPDQMAAYLAQLGRDHRKYHVEPEMYEAVGEALIATLRAFAGPTFSRDAEEIWVQTYTTASSLMIRSAEEDARAHPPSWTAQVLQNENRGNGIAVITLAPDNVLQYTAGQHITIQTRRWPYVWRPYSVACRPRDDGLISLHVKAVPGGWVSNALVHHTSPGDEVILGPALGTMTLEGSGDRDLLCIAGGTGLAPIKAIAEQVIRDRRPGRRREVHLFCGARTRSELYDMRDLWRLCDVYPWLYLTPVTSDDPAFDGMQGNVGRVAARYMPHRDCEAYIAGPADMVRETLSVLTRAGMPPERIRYDAALVAGYPRVGSGM
jgi:NAD(P)H-flavin reductase/hemoglobin-like flavoprotein